MAIHQILLYCTFLWDFASALGLLQFYNNIFYYYILLFSTDIPPVTDLKENLIAHYDTRVYDGFLSWKPIYQSYNASFTEDDEALLDYAYFVGLTCDGKAVIDVRKILHVVSHSGTVNCSYKSDYFL